MLRHPVTLEAFGTAGVAFVWGWLLPVRHWRVLPAFVPAAATVVLWYACRWLAGIDAIAPFVSGVTVSLMAHVLWRNHLRLHAIRQGE